MRLRLLLLIALLLFPGIAFARGGGGCFLAGTPVSTPQGSVPIEQLMPGQVVLAFDGTGVTSAKIVEIFKVQRDYYFEISAGGHTVRATAEHPFYIGDGKFVEAAQLK